MDQGVGFQGPRSQGVGQQGLVGSRGRPTGYLVGQGVGLGVSGGQGEGLQGPRGSRGRPSGSQGVKG